MVHPLGILIVLIALGIIWTVGWAVIVARSGHPIPFEALEGSETRVRISLLAGMVIVAVVLFVLTLRALPYEAARRAELGAPQVTGAATGAQWSWTLSRKQLPMGVPVEFAVTSRDVNYDFAIYDPHGHLVAQTQAMPGYTNRLIHVFSTPGTYTVRCLEYCGLGHHTMTRRSR
jgi:cytochrome c oxidase subunit 2